MNSNIFLRNFGEFHGMANLTTTGELTLRLIRRSHAATACAELTLAL
jgi:hypothetical protein